MTEDEALAKWDVEIEQCKGDAEIQHSLADELLIEALCAAGWSRLAAKWQQASQHWWWA